MNAESFDAAETAELGFYVYLYSDPRTNEPFYVGKGRGNRVFAHLKEDSEHEKVLRIREIEASGMQPRLEILAFGLDEETAFKVEAAAIDLVGFDRLTNRVIGHGARSYGRMSIETVHTRLAARPITEFQHDVLIIRIGASVTRARQHLTHRFDGQSEESAIALYDATRGAWVIGKDRRDSIKFALAAHEGIVREVFHIATWLPGGSTSYFDRTLRPSSDRWEFVGRVADEQVRSLYRLRSVKHLFPAGDVYPVRTFRAGPAREDLGEA